MFGIGGSHQIDPYLVVLRENFALVGYLFQQGTPYVTYPRQEKVDRPDSGKEEGFMNRVKGLRFIGLEITAEIFISEDP